MIVFSWFKKNFDRKFWVPWDTLGVHGARISGGPRSRILPISNSYHLGSIQSSLATFTPKSRQKSKTDSIMVWLVKYWIPENRTMNPYASTHMPRIGQPKRTTRMPPKKAAEPLTLCHWKKNRNVRSRPITNASPLRNKICKADKNKSQISGAYSPNLAMKQLTFPMARSPLSKSKSTPRKRNATPKPARPTPISGS